ncbi:MAG: flagellar M-ring protein FliF, partial [Cellulomonas sp.]|nr:flagellar M-ring protein FliF [Cellulomonas sp.]
RPLLEGLDGLPGLPAAPGPQPEDNPLLARRREIEAMADEQPTEIAELLRLWMSAPSGGSRR